jgi:hypothetical protein
VSDTAPTAGDGAFRLRTVAVLLAVGILGFVGMLVVGAYAPDFRSGRNGGAHALSNAAVGYSGLIQLAEATGRHPRIIRDDRSFNGTDLLVITPENGGVDVSKPLARTGKPTLVVLPKWATVPDPDHPGWARYLGLQPASSPEGVLAPATKLHVAHHRSGGRPLVSASELGSAIRFRAPRPLQVITGIDQVSASGADATSHRARTLRPLITDGAGGIVLAQVDDSAQYILADPDLLSNQGIRDPGQAASALAMLDWLNTNGAETIDFDVTLNGLGRNPSPLKLLFQPPFLAMTLGVAIALLLAGWHATARFGAPRPRARALGFGKAVLIDNTAALVRRAGRQARFGGRYAAVMRERGRARLGVGTRVTGAAIDEALDRADPRRPFSALAAAAENAQNPAELLAAARALNDWQGRGV